MKNNSPDGVGVVDATDADAWYCEVHPERLMGHDGCGGAGIQESCRIHMLLNKLRLAEHETRETAMVRDDLAARLRVLQRKAERALSGGFDAAYPDRLAPLRQAIEESARGVKGTDGTLAGVRRYLSDVMAEGTPNEQAVARTVSRMLAEPPTDGVQEAPNA